MSASDDRARQERVATLDPALTVVANPLTKCALQDRQGTATPVKAVEPRLGPRTPVWRGLTALQELRAAGVRVAVASDNVRDWCARGGDARAGRRARAPLRVRARAVTDGGPLQVADWLALAGLWPARAICAEEGTCGLLFGGQLDAIAFGARYLCELLARRGNALGSMSHDGMPFHASACAWARGLLPLSFEAQFPSHPLDPWVRGWARGRWIHGKGQHACGGVRAIRIPTAHARLLAFASPFSPIRAPAGLRLALPDFGGACSKRVR